MTDPITINVHLDGRPVNARFRRSMRRMARGWVRGAVAYAVAYAVASLSLYLYRKQWRIIARAMGWR